MINVKPLLVASAIVGMAGAAQATSVSITGSLNNLQLQPLGSNSFDGVGSGQNNLDNFLGGLGFMVDVSDFTIDLGGRSGVRLTFEEVAAESAFATTFTVLGDTMTENCNFWINDSGSGTGCSASQTEVITKDFFANTTLTGADLAFSGGTTGGGELGSFDFGIFYAGASPTPGGGPITVSNLTTFYLAYDDQPGTSVDDNHDDYVIRVTVAPIPLPAAGWMLLAGVGGLFAMRRSRKA